MRGDLRSIASQYWRRALANVLLEQKAVSDGRRKVAMYFGSHSLRHSTIPVGKGRYQIANVCLDDYLGAHEVVHPVKIDLKGTGLRVLQDMVSLISRSPDLTLMLESYPSLLAASGPQGAPIRLLNMLRSNGFDLHDTRQESVLPLDRCGSLYGFVSSVPRLGNLLDSSKPWKG